MTVEWSQLVAVATVLIAVGGYLAEGRVMREKVKRQQESIKNFGARIASLEQRLAVADALAAAAEAEAESPRRRRYTRPTGVPALPMPPADSGGHGGHGQQGDDD